MHRLGISSVLILLICSLTGCSILYSYRNIDRAIRWSLNDYITWDSTQEVQLHTSLTSQLAWHQQTQLPRYRDWLEAIDRTLENDIDVTQLGQAADQLQVFWQDVAIHLQADAVALLTSLSDNQVRELISTLREEQADLESEYDELTPAERIKDRKWKMMKSIKYWLGALDKDQTALIETWAKSMPSYRSHWLQDREHWIDAFEISLQNRHDPKLFSAKTHSLFVTPQDNWSAEYREISQEHREITLQLMADLHNLRTQKQREVERKRIAQWLQRLDRLATN